MIFGGKLECFGANWTFSERFSVPKCKLDYFFSVQTRVSGGKIEVFWVKLIETIEQ